MSNNADYLYAKELQNAFDGAGESDIEEVDFKSPCLKLKASKKSSKIKRSNPHSNLDDDFVNRAHKLFHPQWETLDPTPDIKALFTQFDSTLFGGRLKCVTIAWGTNMSSCAGVCYSCHDGGRKAINMRLSKPLLKLRPRKDLIEVMLRQMIYAFLFLSKKRVNKANFRKIVLRINKLAGTNIAISNTFHSEPSVYRQWWRCNGICQDRGPFFGYVLTKANHVPDSGDQWFPKHLSDCGGTFMKIKGPEQGPNERRIRSKRRENNSEGRSVGSVELRSSTSPELSVSNSSVSTLTDAKSTKENGYSELFTSRSSGNSAIAKAFPPSSYPGLSSDPFNIDINSSSSGSNRSRKAVASSGGNLRNVIGFKDIGGLGDSDNSGGRNFGRTISDGRNATPSFGDGSQANSLASNSFRLNNAPTNSSPGVEVDREHLRNIWCKRFSSTNSAASIPGDKCQDIAKQPTGDAKRRRISGDDPSATNTSDVIFVSDENNPKTDNQWIAVDEEVMLKDYQEPIITLSSDDDQDSDVDDYCKPKINQNMTVSERQNMIKQEIVDESINLCDDDIELIDDEYDDNIGATTTQEPANVNEDEFCADLMSDFKRENDCKPSSSRYQNNPDNDIITCFICLDKMPRRVFAEHVNGCTGITRKILPPKRALKKLSAISKEARPKRPSRPSARTTRDILRNAGYTEADLAQITSADETEEEEFLNCSGLGRNLHNGNATTVISSPQELSSSSEDENTRRYRQRNLFRTTRECPVCQKDVEEAEMNDHLDDCLTK